MASTGLKKPIPNKSSFIYDIGTGERNTPYVKKTKGNDLRAKPGKNNGK